MDKSTVWIDGNRVGFQFNVNSMGRRTFHDVAIRTDGKTGRQWAKCNGSRYWIEPIIIKIEGHNPIHIGYEAVEAIGQTKVNGKWVWSNEV